MCAVFAVQILRLGNMNSLLRGDIPVMHHTIHHAWEVLRYLVMLHE